ncbi:zinc finger protein 83-like isoform X1 [Amyelois transitella]|uniref:zinc finger protein 83-like isoform X1 n=1 Tax=Amyelois transitella TaxID=680683 RepID=UPI00067C94FF|nr:zinc finger protein 83-like isoform X1 [Amyelois transitella]
MAHILVLDAIQQDIFVCGLCKVVYNSLHLFLDHKKKSCGNEKELHVNKSSTVISNLVKPAGVEPLVTEKTICEAPVTNTWNKEDQTSYKDINCKYCKKKFRKVKTLLTHLKSHSDNPYQCPVCGRCFVQNSHLQRHILCHKVWPDGLSETTAKNSEADLLCYSCSYCSTILSNYTQFRSHLKIHTSLKKFKCIQSECECFYDTVESLLNHISLSHKNPTYSCYICVKSFDSLENIAVHYQNHNTLKVDAVESKLYKCSQCDATFKRPEKLSLHRLTESHKKICLHCNKTFASDKRLRLHLQIHRKLKSFKCDLCNSSFLMKKYLTSHMLKHGDRQFTCSICNYTFKRQDLLQRHMRLHQTKNQLKCPFRDTLDCKKEFTRTDKLKLHIKFHTKHESGNAVNLKSASGNDGGTVEICILPLDSKNSDNEEV